MSPIRNRHGGRLREDVRIRLGEKIEVVKDGVVQLDKNNNPKTRPVALKTFRFTAQRREPLDRLAAIYGGEVREWQEPATQDRWQLTSEADTIRCLIPPVGGFSQWFELWKAGGCERRCDGISMLNGSPCECPEDGVERARLAKLNPPQACKERTRIVVVLPEVGELGGARVETGSYYAAEELALVQALFEGAMAQGVFIPAELRIAQRRIKRPGEAAKDFTVVEFIASVTAAMDALGTVGDKPAGELEAGTTNDGPPKLKEARAKHERRKAAAPAQDPDPGPGPAAADASRRAPAAARPTDQGIPEKTIEDLLQLFHHGGLREDEAAQVVGLVTGGRTRNVKTLVDSELRAVMDVAGRLSAGTLELVFDGEDAQLLDREGNVVDVGGGGSVIKEAPEYSTAWWLQRMKPAGVTQGQLLRRARALAGELRLDVPKAIDELTEPTLAAALAEWVESERAAKAS